MQLKVVPFLVWALCCACGGDDARLVPPESEDEPQTEVEQQRPPPREGPEGCYIPERTMCNCEIVEADCSEDVGIWTDGCASCAPPP